MAKVKQITIENFRGLRLPLKIDFNKGGKITSAIIYGRNGTGKSSIVDAWEWINKFEISALSREGVSMADFPHKACGGDNCTVSIEFQNAPLTNIKATFNKKKITTPTITGNYSDFKNLSTYPNYLRYADLQTFVLQRKAERYKSIAKFFGLETFLTLQENLQTAIHKQDNNLSKFQDRLSQNYSAIIKVIGQNKIEEKTILAFINSIASKHKINPIKQFGQANGTKSELENIVRTNPIAKELSEWKNFNLKINNFFPVQSLIGSCKQLEDLFIDLKKDEENIKNLILSELYKLTIEVLPELDEADKCPVCDENYKGNLLDHVTIKHQSLESLNKKKTDFDNTKSTLERQLLIIQKKVAIIESETSKSIISEFESFFSLIKTIHEDSSKINSLLKKELKSIQKFSISKEPCIKTIENIGGMESEMKKIISDKIKQLSLDEDTITLAEDYSNLSNIIESYTNYLINREIVNYLKVINGGLSTVLNTLTSYIQTQIQDSFASISSDVVEYFNVLEDSNPFIKNPELKLITGKDKAIELEIEFVTEKITPAFKFMSESQINSFGLAIFLAAVKHFNRDFKFFILDDVINSFDSFKRPKVSQLLATKFKDFQVLLITHDQIFFDTVQRDCPEWQRYKFSGWDYNLGPRYKLSKNYSEEIQEYLNDDNAITAGQTLGRYLEWTLSILNENLQTPIQYKLDNSYTLAELFYPFVKRLKEKLQRINRQSKLTLLVDQFESMTIFRNYCAHYKNESNQFTTPEIQSIFDKWKEIEEMLFCRECKSYINYEKIDNKEYLKCNCGKVDLKEVSVIVESK